MCQIWRKGKGSFHTSAKSITTALGRSGGKKNDRDGSSCYHIMNGVMMVLSGFYNILYNLNITVVLDGWGYLGWMIICFLF